MFLWLVIAWNVSRSSLMIRDSSVFEISCGKRQTHSPMLPRRLPSAWGITTLQLEQQSVGFEYFLQQLYCTTPSFWPRLSDICCYTSCISELKIIIRTDSGVNRIGSKPCRTKTRLFACRELLRTRLRHGCVLLYNAEWPWTTALGLYTHNNVYAD